MASDLGFLARAGWAVGAPIVAWGYGVGVAPRVIIDLDGSVRVSVRAGGELLLEPLMAGAVLLPAALSGVLLSNVAAGAAVLAGAAMSGAVEAFAPYEVQLTGAVRSPTVVGAVTTSAQLSGRVIGVDGLTGGVLTGPAGSSGVRT